MFPNWEMGDVIDIFPYEGKITRHGTDEVLAWFELEDRGADRRSARRPHSADHRPWPDRQGPRALGRRWFSTVFRRPAGAADTGKVSPAQKMVWARYVAEGIRPHLLRTQDDHGHLYGTPRAP